MLSYQHIYHAGNLADVHKHAALAWTLDYLTRKDKPLSYLETHAGRASYDLTDAAALKTGEAAQGVARLAQGFDPDHPYRRVLDATRASHGADAYPGSPLIAAQLLRPTDPMHLAELHPREHAALDLAMSPYRAQCHNRDGFNMAYSQIPPTPRRGILLVDPSYEIKTDYTDIPRHLVKLNRAWNVGVLMLWYPILTNGAHQDMTRELRSTLANGLLHEVRFPPARPGHGMVGSGLFIMNAPYGLADELARIKALFDPLNS
ncbi:MAG: 23S rRNA (adenine(2030)-N(6))-methyltransferase RlmJ [Sulfitobacter sp.]